MMGRTSGIALVAGSLLAAIPLEAQSLGEVARKERERRSRLTAETPVIDNRGLEEHRLSSSPASGEEAPRQQTDSLDSPETPADPADPADEESPRLSEREIRDLRSKWNRIWQEQMNEARRDLAKARDDVHQCRSAGSFFFVPLAVDCDGVHERLAEAEARLREVQVNRYNWELLLPR